MFFSLLLTFPFRGGILSSAHKFKLLKQRKLEMPVTDILEQNCRLYGNDVCLVEINPELKDSQRITWREYDLMQPTPSPYHRRESTWSIFNEKANRFANLLTSRGIKKGDNLFISSVNEEKLKTKLPYIEKVTVKRKLPGTYTLKVTDAAEYVCYLSGDKYYPVSKSGRVLSEAAEKPEGIPEISAGGLTLKVGHKLIFAKEKTETTLDEIFASAEKTKLKITKIDITDELAITVGVDGRFTVNLGTSNYTDKKFAHLAGMIKNMDETAKGKINLSMWTPTNTEGSFVSSDSGG